ncbi:MAG TPA: hypothetical protein VNT79_14120, partial [Phycisphaerae bacterium]|nr:hypothetical protein [Phycisphaerae bacterium]
MSKPPQRSRSKTRKASGPREGQRGGTSIAGSGRVARASWIWTGVLAAIAALLTGILASQLRKSWSMTGAMMRAEAAGVNRKSLDSAVRRAVEGKPFLAKRFAVSDLLNKLDGVRRGDIDAASVVQAAAAEVDRDAENLLSRMIYAAIVDIDFVRQQGPSPVVTTQPVEGSDGTALQRFNQMRLAIEHDAPARMASLHRNELIRDCTRVVGEFVRRPD